MTRFSMRPTRLVFIVFLTGGLMSTQWSAARAATLGTTCPAPHFSKVGTGASSTAVADLNRDGRADVAVANSSDDRENGTDDTVSILLNNGHSALVESTRIRIGNRTPFAIVAADFDGDGDTDLSTANSDVDDRSVTILLGDGKGGFTVRAPVALGTPVTGQATGDFNADGRQDIAIGAGDQGVDVLLNAGGGDFTKTVGSPYAAGPGTREVLAADFNSDGKLDLLTSAGNADTPRILLGDGAGNLAVASSSLPTESGQAVSDFNRDGKTDIAQVSASRVRVLLGNGQAGFSEVNGSPFALSRDAAGITAADFDRDGDADIATSKGQFLRNDGSGQLAESAACRSTNDNDVSFDYGNPTAGDIDGDGAPDLLGTDGLTRQLAYLLSSEVSSGGGAAPPSGGGTSAGQADVRVLRAFFSPKTFSVAPTDGSSSGGSSLVYDMSGAGRLDISVSRVAPGYRGIANRAPCRARSANVLRRSLGRRLSRQVRGASRVRRLERSLRARRCHLLRHVGTLVRPSEPAGRTELRFTGRIDGKPLAAGSYVASLSARDPQGDRSSGVKANFRVS